MALDHIRERAGPGGAQRAGGREAERVPDDHDRAPPVHRHADALFLLELRRGDPPRRLPREAEEGVDLASREADHGVRDLGLHHDPAHAAQLDLEQRGLGLQGEEQRIIRPPPCHEPRDEDHSDPVRAVGRRGRAPGESVVTSRGADQHEKARRPLRGPTRSDSFTS